MKASRKRPAEHLRRYLSRPTRDSSALRPTNGTRRGSATAFRTRWASPWSARIGSSAPAIPTFDKTSRRCSGSSNRGTRAQAGVPCRCSARQTSTSCARPGAGYTATTSRTTGCSSATTRAERGAGSHDRGRSSTSRRSPPTRITWWCRRRLSCARRSSNREKDWSARASLGGLVAWPADDRLYIITGGGEVFRSPDTGRSIDLRGRIDGQPAALLAQSTDDLYVALHDGTVKRSTDGGRTWEVRSAP